MATITAKDSSTLYILVENRKEPQKSFVAMNIDYFVALLDTCEIEEIRKESEAIKRSMYYLKKRISKSARDKVNIRYT